MEAGVARWLWRDGKEARILLKSSATIIHPSRDDVQCLIIFRSIAFSISYLNCTAIAKRREKINLKECYNKNPHHCRTIAIIITVLPSSTVFLHPVTVGLIIKNLSHLLHIPF